MSVIRNIIDGNEAAARYYEYMRPARRDGDKLPVKRVKPGDSERAGMVRELNNYLDRLHFGYEAVAPKMNTLICVRCHQPLRERTRLVRSIYERDGRLDFYVCEEC